MADDIISVSAARAMKAAGGQLVLNAATARTLSDDHGQIVDVIVVNAIEAEQLAQVPVIDTLAGALGAAKQLAGRSPSLS
ncbi:hypothetical protein [Ciceribacter sp. RN22]|uniref:hypothetical protein n=1 Tax=Ciceribacter sp. RN22 TaxID=2954932 RepID=UPI002092D2FB|nr:hypothetical protein [Ciceribacter sp. RN22]MCO6179297.1 hypothetical protein [Ciceribacter sp. RN22]